MPILDNRTFITRNLRSALVFRQMTYPILISNMQRPLLQIPKPRSGTNVKTTIDVHTALLLSLCLHWTVPSNLPFPSPTEDDILRWEWRVGLHPYYQHENAKCGEKWCLSGYLNLSQRQTILLKNNSTHLGLKVT